MGRLSNKVAIVTGAGRGIGKAVAELFAAEGAKVAVLSRTQANVDEVVAGINNTGGEAAGFACDILDLQSVEQATNAAIAHFGGVDILVNNAHDTRDMTSSLMKMETERMQRQFAAGPLATLKFMQLCQPLMVTRGGGSIINMASGAGLTGGPGYGAYSVSKEGVRSLSRTAAREWGKRNIRVNNVCPVALTEAMQEAIDKGFDATPQTPIPRYGDTKEDVAPIVLFLASDDAKYMTGYTLMADGGMVIDTAR